MTDKIYAVLKKKVDEAYAVPPTHFNHFFINNLFKLSASSLKFLPFKIILPLAFLFSLLLYFIFGLIIVRLTSALQYGF